jgi:bifunctional NMN adenylyltransferase/nudix hydrolase
MKQYKTAVVILRAQPPHIAHVELIREAYDIADHVILIFGSSYLPRSYKNPFTLAERTAMMQEALYDAGMPAASGFQYFGSPDFNDNNAWAANIQDIVGDSGKTVLVGHMKDNSSFYLDMFPQWDRFDPGLVHPLNATDVRDLYFRKDCNLRYFSDVLPTSVISFLRDFKATEEYQQVIREREHIEMYRRQYEHLPYAPVFVTVDNVIFQCGHVLMVKRRSEPGKGLWALPGGFLNAATDHSLEDAAIRELKEETKIKIPVPVLKGSIKGNKVFDAINRSARGRTITHAFHYVLPDGELPKVRGADDAEKAVWIPISQVNREECFEDHYLIIQHFVGATK